MKSSKLFIIATVIAGILFNSCSFTGMEVWKKGRYYHTEIADDFSERKIRKIGVYVFSEGGAVDGTQSSLTAGRIISAIMLAPTFWGLFLLMPPTATGAQEYFFLDEITNNSEFNPVLDNAGPSLELGIQVSRRLQKIGYKAKVIEELGHKSKVNVDACIDNAKNKKYDAAMIVHYNAIEKWNYYGNLASIIFRMTEKNEFLFVPNAALFDTKTREIIWKSSYYGLVENAHHFNIIGEPFSRPSNKAIMEMNANTYLEAAGKAADVLLNPSYWKGSFKSLPVIKTKGNKI